MKLSKILVLFFVIICYTAISAQKIMPYRMVTVSNSQWCDPRQSNVVQHEIDLMIQNGFNGVIIGSYKFMPTYFVDYARTKYPEAEQFDIKKVNQNIETLRANMQYAKQKGIQYIVSGSYSNYAPTNFWKAHQAELNPNGIFNRLLDNSHQNDLYKSAMTGKGDVIQAQQWGNSYFKDFFCYSTRLMLDVLPELNGFLNAYAENAWTYNLDKLKADTWKSWKECVNYEKTNDEFVDYGNTLYKILKEKRGDNFVFGLRDWYVKPADLKRIEIEPGKLLISIKYGGYDQPIVNYPPWAKDLLDQGFSVLIDFQGYDAENPHPLYWYDNAFDLQMIKNIENAGFPGIVYHDFTTRSKGDLGNPIRLLTRETFGAALNHKKFNKTDAITFLQFYYGKASEQLIQSMLDVTHSQEYLIKLQPSWFWQGDGLTPGGLTDRRVWHYIDNPEGPVGMDFARQNVVAVPLYSQSIINKNVDLKTKEWQKSGKITPLQAIDSMISDANKAVKSVELARKQQSPVNSNKSEIIASAYINHVVILRDAAFTRATIYYLASGGQFDGKYNNDMTKLNTGINLTKEMMDELSITMLQDLVLRELCKKYAPRRSEMRSAKGYDHCVRLAKVMGLKLEVPDENDELVKTNVLSISKLIENKK
jgi:hypothetical protein